jgi:hypothetical protein
VNQTTDERLLARIEGATLGGRALLCTLARMGSALRRDDPVRAHLLLHAIQSHPFYKGGRLLFDVLELEDLMLDGPPPAPVGRTSLWAVTDSLVDLLRVLTRLSSELQEGGNGHPPREDVEPPASRDEEEPAADLPELDPSEYLYDLVVLGIVAEASRGMAGASRSGSAEEVGSAGPPSPGSPR